MTPLPSISVIIPALNEEGAIGLVIDRLRTLPLHAEIIVVDDGSNDRTGAIAASKEAIVLRHPMPGGYGRSLKDGIRRATNDVIVITDADGTYPIESIPTLVKRFAEGFDMVVGARQGIHYRGSLLKMPARALLKWLVEFTTGCSIPDINSGLRVLRRSDAMAIESELCNGFSFTTTMTLIYLLSGKYVTYLPIPYAHRIGTSKVRIVRDSLRTLQYIVEVIARKNPVKLFGLLAGIHSILACACIAIAAGTSSAPFLVSATMFLAGAIVTIAIGFHAHSVGR